jgi:hypothetical protein
MIPWLQLVSGRSLGGRLSPKPPRRETTVDFITTVAASDSQHIDNGGPRRVHHSRREEGDYTVNNRGNLLELAEALRSNGDDPDITLCAIDAERCAKALTMVAAAKSRRPARAFTVAAILVALAIGGVVGHMV